MNTTTWFPGSAWEPNELQALPAELWFDSRLREAEPPRQCVPRQEPGNERVSGGDQREVSLILAILWTLASSPIHAADKAKIVFIVGEPSHGPMAHEHRAGNMILAAALNRSGLNVETIAKRE